MTVLRRVRHHHSIPIPKYVTQSLPFGEFLGDMAALGVISVGHEGQRYAVIAARSNQRWWLLPLDNRRATATGLEMLQPVTPAARLAKAGARTIARFGPHVLLGKGNLRLSGLPDLGEAFNGRVAHVAYFTGTDGPHRKTAMQVMDARGTILGYAKLSRNSHVRPYLRNEAQMLALVAALGLKTADVPAVLAMRDDDALTLLVTDSLKSTGHTAPSVPGETHLTFLHELHARTGRIGAVETLDDLSSRASELTLLSGSEWMMRLAKVDGALRPVAETMSVCLAHGDFTPWNTFLQDSRLYVFDWEYANLAWPVGFDLTHFLLATIPPDKQPHSLPDLLNRISHEHYGGNKTAAWRALLLSLSCHAVFYLGRLLEAGSPLSDWIEGPARAEMIDCLLAQRDTLT